MKESGGLDKWNVQNETNSSNSSSFFKINKMKQ